MTAPIRIYIADDHTIVRDGLAVMLQVHSDITVVGSGSDGRQAVKEIEQLHPDVVIMDIAMPNLNGIEAALLLRDVAPAVKTIMLSMYATKEHIFRALQAGARGYLLKNSAGSELVNAIRIVQSGQRYLSQKISDTVVDDYLLESRAAGPLDALSTREREVLQLVAEGHSSAQVAAMLSLSPKSIETYRSRLMQKIGVSDLPSLVKFSIHHGLISLE
ncbi:MULTISPECIES: response regulator transcription factor [unclassified Herbaspirillum]|uniref:response regulator n=1 Tax=unclassified Herbaspirillum TaxID=2624150 RepID=UPI000E2F3D00|nr:MULTISPECIES: response regulator transcription factor [unclassified Herbaspirillum]RFB73249.1 DNA-binding response regulator [Herbaspirillum sp. 3R-3a1]TFI10941.1 response regulator transcription factor [Herbaspirillum sp. 3R11]TFI16849.1 response regulator transcription factor [Herbaspirillum sp. 3R-11]TFI30495.1 response regulator transcription factor [Herbaspirillum sp. 3C11]